MGSSPLSHWARIQPQNLSQHSSPATPTWWNVPAMTNYTCSLSFSLIISWHCLNPPMQTALWEEGKRFILILPISVLSRGNKKPNNPTCAWPPLRQHHISPFSFTLDLFPNQDHPFPSQETIKHRLLQSMAKDGFNLTVKMWTRPGLISPHARFQARRRVASLTTCMTWEGDVWFSSKDGEHSQVPLVITSKWVHGTRYELSQQPVSPCVILK